MASDDLRDERAGPRAGDERAGPRAGDERAGPRAGDEQQSGSRAYDTLRRLERRLDEASEAAERLIAQAASEAAKERRRPPPAGWQVPDDGSADAVRESDLEVLVQLIQTLRDRIPPELQARLAEALRELLLAARALIDWYLERLEGRKVEPAEVQDIPIL
jgi:hypothetical protein